MDDLALHPQRYSLFLELALKDMGRILKFMTKEPRQLLWKLIEEEKTERAIAWRGCSLIKFG